jgi:glycopeptide antibiotics resistance protein
MTRKYLWVPFLLYFTLLAKLILFKKQIGAVSYESYSEVLSFRQNLDRINLVPFRSTMSLLHEGINLFVIQNIGGNIFGFTPLGIFLPILFPSLSSFSKVFITVFAISTGFELVQLVTVLGVCDIDDVILNTLGGIFGFILYKVFFYFLPRRNNYSAQQL